MKTTRHSSILTARFAMTLGFAIAIPLAPAWAILANAGPASAAPTASSVPARHHGGSDYSSITGWRAGAPSESEVSTYGGSHKHLWVEQQLYGPGVVVVPHVDTTVHQSR